VIVNNKEFASFKTDKKGKFKIKSINPADSMLFLADGYASANTVIGNAKSIKVILFPITKDEAVDIGYGSQNSKTLTSSVTVLSSNDFNKVVAVDIYSYLRGKIPGLQIIKNSSSSLTRPQIMLRGTGSFSGTYEPLIVIDGIQNASIENLDPNDVASVTVLKDGSAQAIYGSQASGGVILIKTKK
jgi:iron complex outermembrane receptor protein